MELAGRYLSGSLSSLQPLVEEDFPLNPFVTMGNITSQRPYRAPSPIAFVPPGRKGPGFLVGFR